MIDLKGHAALVTGSTHGVGRAIALALAQAGANVVIHGLEAGPDADAVLDQCRRCGVAASFVPMDLTGPTQQVVADLFEAALAAQEGIDILVNNAGHFLDLPFEQMTLDRFEKTLRLNVTAPYFLTQAFARHWIAHNVAGRVLLTGSINGRLAEPDSTAYDTSKGAVEMMVKTLCVALAPHNIRVNGLAPGLVRTHATAWLDQNLPVARWMEHHTPNGRVPDAQVCGPAAAFLVSDAAEHIHGHMLLVDGGMSAWQQPKPMT
ncbi:MAG TPA: SDR family oxidoreductase [Phycisphaeraceae bacterium]